MSESRSVVRVVFESSPRAAVKPENPGLGVDQADHAINASAPAGRHGPVTVTVAVTVNDGGHSGSNYDHMAFSSRLGGPAAGLALEHWTDGPWLDEWVEICISLEAFQHSAIPQK